jgi:hypothetical protein
LSSVRMWLSSRRPAPPTALAVWLGRHEPQGLPTPGLLAAAGLEALARVKARPGRVRESAFELLGADALLTYACEAALDLEDPLRGLESLLARVAAAP